MKKQRWYFSEEFFVRKSTDLFNKKNERKKKVDFHGKTILEKETSCQKKQLVDWP